MFKRKALELTGSLEEGPTFSGLPSEGEGRRKWEEKKEGEGRGLGNIKKKKKEVLNETEEVGEGGESSGTQPALATWENKVAICTLRVPPEGPFPR